MTDRQHRLRLFSPRKHGFSRDQNRVWAAWEIVYTLVDFTAALMFIVGSVMFLYTDWVTRGTWLFIIGSFCFAMKPTIRLVREIHLLRIGRAEQVAKHLRN